jgi:hypothetical protein
VALHVTRSSGAVRIGRALDAARLARVTHATVAALTRVDALDAGATAEVAARTIRRAVGVLRALCAHAAAITGGLARLAAVAVGQALHAHVELAAAAARRLPDAAALRVARQRAHREHVIAAPVYAAISRAPALDADVAQASWLATPAVGVDDTLDAVAARAVTALARAVALVTALGARVELIVEEL